MERDRACSPKLVVTISPSPAFACPAILSGRKVFQNCILRNKIFVVCFHFSRVKDQSWKLGPVRSGSEMYWLLPRQTYALVRARHRSVTRRRPELANCRQAITLACEALLSCFRSGNQVLLSGTEGRPLIANIAGELVKRFSRPRPLDPLLAEKLGSDLASHCRPCPSPTVHGWHDCIRQ